jgi:hypothetical protein
MGSPVQRVAGQFVDDVVPCHRWASRKQQLGMYRRGQHQAECEAHRSGLKALRVDEEILEARAPHYQHYTALRGIPVSDYWGTVQINDVEEGTQLVWTGTFEPRIPGTGRLLASLLGLAISRVAGRAVSIAEQSADTGA